MFEHFAGRMSLDDAIERIKINTRGLAKQQRTWLKRLPEIRWIDVAEADPPETILARAHDLLAGG